VTGRSGMVGMIVKINAEMTADQTFFEILTGLTAALDARDVDLVLAVDQHDNPVRPYERMLERNMLDGFILNAPVPDDARVSFLRKRGVPFVMHGQSTLDPDYPFFGIDNAGVSAEAVNLLAALGHRRIALLNGNAHYSYAVDRLQGFAEATIAAGIAVPDQFVAQQSPSEGFGYTQGLAMLSGRLGARPTAIVCASTLIAAGVMKAALAAGADRWLAGAAALLGAVPERHGPRADQAVLQFVSGDRLGAAGLDLVRGVEFHRAVRADRDPDPVLPGQYLGGCTVARSRSSGDGSELYRPEDSHFHEHYDAALAPLYGQRAAFGLWRGVENCPYS